MKRSIREFNRENADRFREARVVVRNEFSGLNAHDQYFNAFARLLKPDPLGRVSMLGTDQRDLLIPLVRQEIAETFEEPGVVLDVGCGDGKTFSLFADALPAGTEVDAFDPNPEYIRQFEKRLGRQPQLKLRQCVTAGFEDGAMDIGDGYRLITAIHVLYFFDDLEDAAVSIYQRLAPGGSAVIVFADELEAYTGIVLRAYLDRSGDHPARVMNEAICWRRLELFSKLKDVLDVACPDFKASVHLQRQGSRLYGNSISDIIALSNLTGLAAFEDLRKFDIAAELIELTPGAVGFRIEDDPEQARYGMLSVAQPQVVVTIRKHAA